MKPQVFNLDNQDTVAETIASTVAPSDRLTPTSRGWRPPRDVVIGACVCVVMGLITYSVVQPIRHKRGQRMCLSNLRQIVLGTKLYVRDYDEKMPLVFADNDGSRSFDSVSDIGWTEAIEPQLRGRWLYQCPAEPGYPDWRDSLGARYCDYFFNARLSARPESTIDYVSEVVIFGDHIAGNAANYVSQSKALDRVAATRHFEGANYAFVDGHVKWMKPTLINVGAASPGHYSLRFGKYRPQPGLPPTSDRAR